MKFFVQNKKMLLVISSLLLSSMAAFAADKKLDNDAWDWTYLGKVDTPNHLFPGTQVVKFRDTSSGVVCYIYTNKFATASNTVTDGVTSSGVKGDEIGTMSCVSERR
jgi:hypothetical protein